MNTESNNNKLWEVELLRTYINNGKRVHIYGIIYSKTIIHPVTKLYDDHWIETQIKASDVFRDITRQDIFSTQQLCFASPKHVDYVTVVDGKLKQIAKENQTEE